MRYLLDTNIITALAHGDVAALNRLRALGASDEIYTCFIVIGEWEYGVRHAVGERRRAQIRAAGNAIFAALDGVWESSSDISIRYGILCAQLRAAGHMIPTNDVWIAATALAHNATVVTPDPHFARVTELRAVDWTQS